MVRQVHQDYSSSTGWDHIATCRTLLLLLLYTAIPPGRGKEYRELKFKCHEKEISGPLDAWPNVVHYSEYEGKALLYLTEYKTASSAGPQLVRCPEDPCFMEILADYLLRQRKKIPHSCESDLVFLVSNQPRMEQMSAEHTHTRACVCVCVCVCVTFSLFCLLFPGRRRASLRREEVEQIHLYDIQHLHGRTRVHTHPEVCVHYLRREEQLQRGNGQSGIIDATLIEIPADNIRQENESRKTRRWIGICCKTVQEGNGVSVSMSREGTHRKSEDSSPDRHPKQQ